MASFASTHDIETVGRGVGVRVGVGVGVGEGVGVAVGEGVSVGVGMGVGVGVSVGTGVGVGVGVDIGIGVGVASVSNPPEKPIPAIVATEIRRTTIIAIRMSFINLPEIAAFVCD